MYFDNCKTMDELKKAYKSLAMKHHPDLGGDLEAMKRINNEYERFFNILKKQKNEDAEQGKATVTTEDAEDFIIILDILFKLDGLNIELCGRWLWIDGETMKHKEELKKAGCKWCKNKKKWSWHYAEDSVYRSKKAMTMDAIRDKYGSQKLTRTNYTYLTA